MVGGAAEIQGQDPVDLLPAHHAGDIELLHAGARTGHTRGGRAGKARTLDAIPHDDDQLRVRRAAEFLAQDIGSLYGGVENRVFEP